MIKYHLSKLASERKFKISELSRETGINKGALMRLCHETAERVDLEVIAQLCNYFDCSVCELFDQRS